MQKRLAYSISSFGFPAENGYHVTYFYCHLPWHTELPITSEGLWVYVLCASHVSRDMADLEEGELGISWRL